MQTFFPGTKIPIQGLTKNVWISVRSLGGGAASFALTKLY